MTDKTQKAYIELISECLPKLTEDELFKIFTLSKNTIDNRFSTPKVSDEELKKNLIRNYREDKFKSVVSKIHERVNQTNLTVTFNSKSNNSVQFITLEDEWVLIHIKIEKVKDDEPKVLVSWKTKKNEKETIVSEVTNYDEFILWFDVFI